MSSGGPKMVERSYGVAGNGLKWSKNQEIIGDSRWPTGSRSRFAGLIPALPAAVGREISRSALCGCPSPNIPARV